MKNWIQKYFTFWQPIALAMILFSICVAAEWVFGFFFTLVLIFWLVNTFITTGYPWDNDKR